ncbi:Maf family protein [Glaciecola siphonariae]|uniref:7-methyl-GTP pyrophosphatase n=1 Tax=Glaciecola siphonariae TaxID=521012 RepID=A0ABV9LTI7_9ALTE
MKSSTIKFLLASSSPYRAKMLAQLGIAFEQCAPDIDEAPLAGELPRDMAQRLSKQKAQALRAQFPEHIVIASDQVACIEGELTPITKPGSVSKARAQLQACSAKQVYFHTGLCVTAPEHIAKARNQNADVSMVETFSVKFRALDHAQICRYIDIEQPLQCAGSFKAEGLGIRLFESFDGRDYNTLIGLPLMALIDILLGFGIDILNTQKTKEDK